MTEEELFDMVIPPGVPRSVLMEVVKKFDVKIVTHSQKLNFANMDGIERDLLAFRGKKEVIEEVEKFVGNQ
jgi:hypothetical protein